MKIFLDDIRVPHDCKEYMAKRLPQNMLSVYEEEWLVVRDYRAFQDMFKLNYGIITHVSFDHDLSDEHYSPLMFADDPKLYNSLYDTFKTKTGLHCAQWMKKYYKMKGFSLPAIFIHTMNPVGYKNIYSLFN